MKMIYKRWIIMVVLLCSWTDILYSNDDITITIERYKKLSLSTLLEKGNNFYGSNKKDSAMICYSLIYNYISATDDTISKQIVCQALNRASIIHYYHCNYKQGLELLLKALAICEDTGYKSYIGRVYNNIGNVYYQFKDYKSAHKYYKLAYANISDKYISSAVLNNLGMLADEENRLDSALLLYRRAYKERKLLADSAYNPAINNIGVIQKKLKYYDSAFFYFRKALNDARKVENGEREAMLLSNIASIHIELGDVDSAVYYLQLSSSIADMANLFNTLASNYMSFSKIEEARGNTGLAFDYYKKYSVINDSIFNASKYATINELQFMYDMAKVDKQIKEFSIEREIKSRTIKMQQRLQLAMGLTLIIVMCSLMVLYRKNKTINRAYNHLVEKNIEISNSHKLNEQMKSEYEGRLSNIFASCGQEVNIPSSISSVHKYKNDKLASEILKIMSDKDVVCNVEFSLDMLVEMAGSNHTYVSQIINEEFKKNLNTVVNEYRIKEACLILSDPECKKYSIDAVSKMVGFKHKSTFNPIFKQMIGVTPSFYLKSVNKL